MLFQKVELSWTQKLSLSSGIEGQSQNYYTFNKGISKCSKVHKGRVLFLVRGQSNVPLSSSNQPDLVSQRLICSLNLVNLNQTLVIRIIARACPTSKGGSLNSGFLRVQSQINSKEEPLFSPLIMSAYEEFKTRLCIFESSSLTLYKNVSR